MEHGAYYVHKATAHRTEELYLFTVFWKNTNSLQALSAQLDQEGVLYRKPFLESSPGLSDAGLPA